jgi:hypothetical protein
MAIPAGPSFDAGIQGLPAAEIEVTDAEVSAVGKHDRFAERREKLLLDIIEYTWHFTVSVLSETVLRQFLTIKPATHLSQVGKRFFTTPSVRTF